MSSPACTPCTVHNGVTASYETASPVVNRACLVVHVHQLCGKLWDVLLGSVCFPMAIYMDVVSDIVVINRVSTKLQALGTNSCQKLGNDVANPLWSWIWCLPHFAPAETHILSPLHHFWTQTSVQMQCMLKLQQQTKKAAKTGGHKVKEEEENSCFQPTK